MKTLIYTFIKIAAIICCVLLFQCDETVDLQIINGKESIVKWQKPLINQAMYLFYTHLFAASLHENLIYQATVEKWIEDIKNSGSLKKSRLLNSDIQKQADLLHKMLFSSFLFIKEQHKIEQGGKLKHTVRLEKYKTEDANNQLKYQYRLVKSEHNYQAIKTKYLEINGISQLIVNQEKDSQEIVKKKYQFKGHDFYFEKINKYKIYFKALGLYYTYLDSSVQTYPFNKFMIISELFSKGTILGENKDFTVEIKTSITVLLNLEIIEPVAGQVAISIGENKILIDFGNRKADNLFSIYLDNNPPLKLRISNHYTGI